jgi:chromosome segregation ATPase
MLNRIGIPLLVLLCLGLATGLIIASKRANQRQALDTETIATYSNKWVATSSDLDMQKQRAAEFERDLANRGDALTRLTNDFSRVVTEYSHVSTSLAKTEATLKATEEEVKRREVRIAELEGQNQNLDKQALELSGAITNLTFQIAETQRKLTASEGDRAFLEKELRRLTLEKAELERQFNDLKVLRAQVAKLKEELTIARRLEWIRRGLFASTEEKGAQRLMTFTPPPPKEQKPQSDLNVEVDSEGNVRVVPPTNAPPPEPAQPSAQ